jgi:hypothetical protein
VREVAALGAIAFAVHALALAFVFPGYYDPLWPHHSDFYEPAAMAYGERSLADYLLGWPRPVGMALFVATGYLGIRGAIAFTVAVTLLNCAVTAAALRRFLGDPLDARFLGAYAVYLFLLFTHPHFYTFYRHDALSQYSYALLLPAAWFAVRYARTRGTRELGLLATFALLAFLCKETYAPAAFVLAGAYAAATWKEGTARAALAPALAIAAVFAVAMSASLLRGFPFSIEAGNRYQVVLAPVAMAREWLRYAADAFNPLAAAAVMLAALATGLFAGRRSMRFLVALTLPLAAAASWSGNAALPNHHYPGYSWNGAYLMYAPLLALAPLLRGAPIAAAAAGATLLLGIAAPLLDGAEYRRNAWALEQEARQQHLLRAIEDLARAMPGSAAAERVLVTGLAFPFSPFDYGAALGSYPRLRDVRFDVVTYPPDTSPLPHVRSSAPKVRFVPRQRVDIARYDAVWAFYTDGTLLAATPPGEAAQRVGPRGMLAAGDVLLFPEMARVFGAPGRSGPMPDDQAYLRCGTRLLEYEAVGLAESCLATSARISAANPYPFFYLGVIREKQGDLEGAKREFGRALALDDPRWPNPAFRDAIARVDRALPAR